MFDMAKFRNALDSIKDPGTELDSGSGLGSADFWVTMGGREYYVEIKPSNLQKAKDAKSAA